MVKKESLEVWQVFSERLQSVEEEKSRFQKQIKFITENAAAAISEKLQMEEELIYRTQGLEALASLSEAVIQLKDPSKVMELAVQKIPRVLCAENAAIYLWNEKNQELHLAFSQGVNAGLTEQGGTYQIGQGIIGKVAKSREPIFFDNASSLSTLESEYAPIAGVQGFAAVPIATRQNILGVLAVSSPHTWECTPHRFEVLTILGNLIATAIENIKLYQESQHHAKRWQSLCNLSSIISSSLHLDEVYGTFARTLKEAVKLDWAAVVLIEETEKRLRTMALTSQMGSNWKPGEYLPLEGTAVAWVAAHHKPTYSPDLEEERLFWTDKELLNQGIRTAIRLPLIFKSKVFGCLVLGSSQPQAYTQEDQDMLGKLANLMSVPIYNNLLLEEVSRQKAELESSFFEAIRQWAQVWEGRFPFGKGHSEKVAQYARRMAQQMGLPEAERKTIDMAARLHDIGLVPIPDEILYRKTGLSPSDRVIIEQHPQIGADMLRVFPIFKEVASLVHAHHERYDGRGYPRGLRGAEIPLGARILFIAEEYALMGMEFPSRPAFTPDKAIDYIKKASGSRYDPHVVDVFIQVISG